MAMTLDLVSRWSFPVRAIGMVHMGAVVEALAPLPAAAAWDLRCWSTPGRHVRLGLEFDVWGEVSVDGAVAWRSRAIYLSRSRSAAGAQESAVPEPAADGPWSRQLDLPAPEGTGRAFAAVSGDINPIHLHRLPARLFGFQRAIAHGWWIAGRVAALLERDEAMPGRRLEIVFRRPVVLPSTPHLQVRDVERGSEFRVARADTDALLCSGRLLG
jgi:acyl dehydratase